MEVENDIRARIVEEYTELMDGKKYKETKAMMITAEKLKVSFWGVRKNLISAGVWNNSTSIAVNRLRDSGKSVNEIAEELHCSIKTVESYTAYKMRCLGFLGFYEIILWRICLMGNVMALFVLGTIVGLIYMGIMWWLESRNDRKNVNNRTSSYFSDKRHPYAKELLFMGLLGMVSGLVPIGLNAVPRYSVKLLCTAADKLCYIMAVLAFWISAFCVLEVMLYSIKRKHYLKEIVE